MSVRGLITGQKAVTTAGTEVPLVAASKIVRRCLVKALKANTGAIYLGVNGVSSSTGYQLNAGEEVDLPGLLWKEDDKFDLNAIYIDSAVNVEGVSFIYVE
jgi:hypothetical protein